MFSTISTLRRSVTKNSSSRKTADFAKIAVLVDLALVHAIVNSQTVFLIETRSSQKYLGVFI